MRTTPTVFVVDDDCSVHQLLRGLIESTGLTVETCVDPRALLARVDPALSGCIVLGLREPALSGLELPAELALRHARMPVIFIADDASVPLVVEAMKRGAFDFIEKPFRNQRLLDSVREAIAVDRRTWSRRTEQIAIQLRLAGLTQRERAVLDEIAAGKTSAAIAAALGLKRSTVRYLRARVGEKLGTHHLAELVRLVGTGRQAIP